MMFQRDTFVSSDFWESTIDWNNKSIGLYEQKLDETGLKPAHRALLRFRAFIDRLELLIARYSRGDDIVLLKAYLPEVLDALERYYSEPHFQPFDLQIIDDYVSALQLVSLCVLFDIGELQTAKVVSIINNDGKDGLFDCIASLYLNKPHSRLKLLHPYPYKSLYRAALKPTAEKTVDFIKEFLDSYYGALEATGLYGHHKYPSIAFYGYWSLELAAFVKLLHIPDAAFVENTFYPRDLARFA